jgi:integrase
VEFYELETVQGLVKAAPTVDLRAALALAYGGAIERGALLTLRREHVCDATREVRAVGTKAHRRNRVVRVDAWAWSYVADIVRDRLPTAYLFPDTWREDPELLTRLHRDAVEAMKLTPRLTLHHWAVTNLRAGVPVAVVQAQLGHSTPTLTLKTYGAFMPQGADRAHWAEVVERDHERRKAAS